MDCLIKIEGKPLEKLIEVVSNAIGTLYEPRQLVRIACAEAETERIKAIEGAKTEALLANNEERYAELSAIEKRMVAKELKRQNNINNVVAVAAQSLKDDKEVSSEPVNPDWATRFFDIAQDISDETMQDLWGIILAGEVKRPKSYSLRTLDVLRNISHDEAQLFEKVANYFMFDKSFFIYYDSSFREDNNIDLTYEDIAKLVEIGLIQAGSSVYAHLHNQHGGTITNAITYGNYVILIKQPSKYKEIAFPIYPLTRVGEELCKLLSVKSNNAYMNKFANMLKDDYNDISISCAQLISIDYKRNEYVYDDETLKELTPKSSGNK